MTRALRGLRRVAAGLAVAVGAALLGISAIALGLLVVVKTL